MGRSLRQPLVAAQPALARHPADRELGRCPSDQPWVDISPPCHACAWEFMSPAWGCWAHVGTVYSVSSLQGVLLPSSSAARGGTKQLPTEKTPLPLPSAGTASTEIESFRPIFPLCKAKERQQQPQHSSAGN